MPAPISLVAENSQEAKENKMQNIQTYYPELNQVKPSNKYEAAFVRTGYRVKTFETLKGQGIKFSYKIEASPNVKPERVGMNVYYLSMNAFKKLSSKEGITLEILLD